MNLEHDVRAELLATVRTLVLLHDLVDPPVRLKVVNVKEACATEFALKLSYITVFVLCRLQQQRCSRSRITCTGVSADNCHTLIGGLVAVHLRLRTLVVMLMVIC